MCGVLCDNGSLPQFGGIQLKINQLTGQWKKWGLAGLALGLLLAFAGLYVISGGHIQEYLVWRWMVTFKQPVAPVTDYRILVSKSTHQLSVFHNDQVIKTFRIGISKHGADPRKIWADELTPEGSYLIASMQYKSRFGRSEEHTSELQSPCNLVCRLLLEK